MQKLKISSNSPTILLVTGIAGVVGTTVLASRATLKAAPIFDATALELDKLEYQAHEVVQNGGLRPSEAELRKARVHIYAETGGQLIKLYGPAVILGSLSIAALVGSHKILSDRYANLGASYIALQESIAAYRKRVSTEIGEEKEKQIWVDAREVDRIEMGPNGPKKVKTLVPGPGHGSIYARMFGPSNPNWKDTPEYNVMFLRQVEEHLNRVLRTQGYLFLNRALEELGMDAYEQGATTGWLYERGTGDDFVDFGIWDGTDKDRFYDFMVGNEHEILLDFNVDGDIHTKLNLPKIR